MRSSRVYHALLVILVSLETAASFIPQQATWRTIVPSSNNSKKHDQPLAFVGVVTMMSSRSDYSENDIQALIAERLQAKKVGDFATADKIQMELRNAGVSAPNSFNERRADNSRGGDTSRPPRRQQQRADNSRDSRPPRRQQRSFGPTGHDYLPSQDAGPIQSEYSESDINALLAERLQAKMARDFFTADKIQDELRGAGVSIHDGLKEWRADGVMIGADNKATSRRGSTPQRAGASSDRNRAYTQSEYSNDLSSDDVQQVQDLVAERLGAKKARDFHTADDIRDELRGTWNVLIEDRLRQWSVGGDFGPDHAALSSSDKKKDGYARSVHSGAVADNEEYIVTQIEKRSQAKKDRDYATSDVIRDSLMEDYNVHINDRLMEWSLGGDFGEFVKDRNRDFVRRGGGNLSPDQVAEVLSMLKERVQAKKTRNFDKADSIRDELRSAYAVSVDDKTLEWRVMSDEYAISSVNGGAAALLDEETIAFVQKQLTERLYAKESKDYSVADNIRDELRDSYGVEVDDRTQEWYVEASEQYDKTNFRQKESRTAAPPVMQIDDQSEAQVLKSNTYEKHEPRLEVEQEEDLNVDTSTSDFDLSSLTVVELKARLKDAGLKVGGKKAELIERLTTAA